MAEAEVVLEDLVLAISVEKKDIFPENVLRLEMILEVVVVEAAIGVVAVVVPEPALSAMRKAT